MDRFEMKMIEKSFPKVGSSEDDEQIAVTKWLEAAEIPFTAIPNSTRTPSWGQKKKNKKVGLRSGLPDLLLVLPSDIAKKGIPRLLFVEMKKQKGGTVSKNQKKWISILNTVPFIEAKVCNGAGEAVDFVKDYIDFGVN